MRLRAISGMSCAPSGAATMPRMKRTRNPGAFNASEVYFELHEEFTAGAVHVHADQGFLGPFVEEIVREDAEPHGTVFRADGERQVVAHARVRERVAIE